MSVWVEGAATVRDVVGVLLARVEINWCRGRTGRLRGSDKAWLCGCERVTGSYPERKSSDRRGPSCETGEDECESGGETLSVASAVTMRSWLSLALRAASVTASA